MGKINKSDLLTVTCGEPWDDETVTIEKLREMLKVIKPMVEKRKIFEAMVMEYTRFLPLCPLIMKMYGSREGAFGVTAPTKVFEPIAIEPPFSLESVFFPVNIV